MSEFGNTDVKDKLFASLLQPKTEKKAKGPLIQDLSAPVEDDVIELVADRPVDISAATTSFEKKTAEPRKDAHNDPSPPADEGPTMMEQIMAAQAEAARGAKIAKEVAEKKAAKGFGAGFKKGFFGGSDAPKNAAVQSSKPKDETTAIPTIRANKTAQSSGSGRAAAGLTHVNEDIQKSLAETKTPLSKELEKGEWVTPDLIKQFSTNPVISRGLMDPRCKDALELMKKNPKEAQAKYANDAVVDTFLREFGKVMGGHFEQLGAKQEEAQKAEAGKPNPSTSRGTTVGMSAVKTTSKSSGAVDPASKGSSGYGPLHEQAISRQGMAPQPAGAAKDIEDAKVKEIINNAELTAMLMDPKMQSILQECGDPVKFQRYMRDPVIAAKIKKLFDAGLVGTSK
jgi:hypothetical protein